MSLGQLGELVAGKLLVAEGFTIVAQNYKCRLGELDLVVRGPAGLMFVEVKTRSGLGYGQPAESVTRAKQIKLRRLAQYYLWHQRHSLLSPVEFGVVEVVYNEGRGRYSAHLIRHAF